MGEIAVMLLTGFVGGFAGGLLGIGGGAIYIPAMVLLLHKDQHIAQGVSLAAVVATAVVASTAHLRRGNVDVPTVWWVAPVAVVAGFGAALLADQLDGDVLRRIFGVAALYFAVAMIAGALRTEREALEEGSG